MAILDGVSLKPPYSTPQADSTGLVTRPWQTFYRLIVSLLDPLGSEKDFTILNNQSTPQLITGLTVDSSYVSQAVVEYLIQRVTTGGGAVELLESGVFHLVYKPTSLSWSIVPIGTAGPSSSGITFSITASGQMKYTSTNIAGTSSISKMYYRMRTIAGKNKLYSSL